MLSTISASFAGSKPIRAASKLALALVLEPLASLTEMEVAWLRFFYQFGPFEDLCGSLGCREKRRNGAGQHRVGNLMKVKDIVATIGSLLDRPE